MDSKQSATVFGGIDITVTKRDGSTETVRIAQLSIRQLQKLASVLKDDAAQIEFYTGKPDGWADHLTLESCEAVIEAGRKVNADFFSRHIARQKEIEQLLPKTDMGQVVSIVDALSKSNPALLNDLIQIASPSPSSSPARRPPAD